MTPLSVPWPSDARAAGSFPRAVTHVLQKLGLRDRVQLVIYAYETGLVERGEAARVGA